MSSHGGVVSRRQALSMAGVFVVTAACNPDKLFAPQCELATDGNSNGNVLPAGKDVYISGGDLDAKLPNPTEESLALHLSGAFTTKGRAFASHNLGRNWTVDGEAEISIEAPEIDGYPLYCLAGPARSVSEITLRGNHSRLAKQPLRTGGVLLYGDGSIDRVTFRDFGSLGSETFVAAIVDGTGPASITNSLFLDHDPRFSDTQVTVYFIAGDRDQVLMEGNETRAIGEGNWVQGHTIYQARKGLIRRNRSFGARIGVYGDYFATKGITVEGNGFFGCEHGIQLQLSPTAEDADPSYFSHENYVIGWNEIESSDVNVLLNTYGASTATRFMRGFDIHESLSLRNVNEGATDITRTRTNTCQRAA